MGRASRARVHAGRFEGRRRVRGPCMHARSSSCGSMPRWIIMQAALCLDHGMSCVCGSVAVLVESASDAKARHVAPGDIAKLPQVVIVVLVCFCGRAEWTVSGL